MVLMKIALDRRGTPEALQNNLRQWDTDPEVGGILIFAADDNGFSCETLNPILRAANKPIFGGVFPQIVYGEEHLSTGTLVVGMPKVPQVLVMDRVSERHQDFDAILASGFSDHRSSQAKTMFVFVDGFASRIGALIDALFNTFGLELNYLGGGCGSLSFEPKPCVISNQGLLQDGAVLALFDIPSGIGVAHGWQPISDGFKVTESAGNIIHTLDWRPAYHVYQETVEAHCNQKFANEDFFSIAKRYPFGIAKLGSEMVVRDPIKTQGKHLVCVGEVPQGAFVHILHGDQHSLLAAASNARDIAKGAMGTHVAQAEFFVDCISRLLFWGDEFDTELRAVCDPQLPTIGALTLGEIANNGNDYLEFYNKTSVVGFI
jgi:hypothetical protein